MPDTVTTTPPQLARFKKTDAKLQVVYGEVYAPGVAPDSQRDFMNAEEVRKTAHDFMRRGLSTNVDRNHDNQTFGAAVVESFVARETDPDFLPGSWVVGVHVPDGDTWSAIEKGEINGFSFDGIGSRHPTTMRLELPEELGGETVESAGHKHRFIVKYDASGNFLGGETDEVEGHKHVIARGTVTEPHADHTHRFSFVEMIRAHA